MTWGTSILAELPDQHLHATVVMFRHPWRNLMLAKRRAKYEQWVRDHSTELFGMAYRLCGQYDVAEDLIQETYYEAWKSLGRLRNRGKARAWLFQILRHRYARWARSRSRMPALVHSHEELETVDAAPASSFGNARAERDCLQQALDSLDERFRVTLLMVYLEGLTCQETATRLDLPLGTVLSRIHRAKRQLRAILREYAERDDAGRQPDTSRRYRIGGES